MRLRFQSDCLFQLKQQLSLKSKKKKKKTPSFLHQNITTCLNIYGIFAPKEILLSKKYDKDSKKWFYERTGLESFNNALLLTEYPSIFWSMWKALDFLSRNIQNITSFLISPYSWIHPHEHISASDVAVFHFITLFESKSDTILFFSCTSVLFTKKVRGNGTVQWQHCKCRGNAKEEWT